jgi:hypothetical protein
VSVLAETSRLLERGDFPDASIAALNFIRSEFSELQHEILSQESQANAAAQGSYEHPNGFEKILLAEPVDQIKLLLHSWTDGTLSSALAAEHAHNHRWPFATLVLRGSYRFETYRVTEGVGNAHLYRYASPGDTNAFILQPAGRASLAIQTSFDLIQGASCFSNSATIHRALPATLPLLTLFLQGPADRQQTTVVSPAPAKKTGAINIRRFTENEWRRRVLAHFASVTPARVEKG